MTLGKGVTVTIKYKASSDLLPNGTKEVFFEINGVPRVIQVVDKKSRETPGSGGMFSKALHSACNMVCVWCSVSYISGSLLGCGKDTSLRLRAASNRPSQTCRACELQSEVLQHPQRWPSLKAFSPGAHAKQCQMPEARQLVVCKADAAAQHRHAQHLQAH